MKKKLLPMLLALALAAVLLPGMAFAANSDFVIEDGVLVEYKGSGGAVTIPSSVTSIGNAAFWNCNSLTSVTIPNSVTSIEYAAFFACNGLTGVTIPSSVTAIGYRAFSACENLTSINVESGNPAYISVEGVLFNADETILHTYPAGKSDSSYQVPSSVTTIGDFAYSGCRNLTSVTIPNSVNMIGLCAFENCSHLTNVTVSNSVTAIDTYAFARCIRLTDVYYGGSEGQWKRIKIDNTDNGNDPLLGAAIHYSNVPAESETPTVAFDITSAAIGAAVAVVIIAVLALVLKKKKPAQ